MAREVKRSKLKRKKGTQVASAKGEWPKMVMGVKIKNQKEMDKLIKSVRGENIPGFRGRLD